MVKDVQRHLPDPGRFSYIDVMAAPKPGSGSGVEGGYGLTGMKYALDEVKVSGGIAQLGRVKGREVFSVVAP